MATGPAADGGDREAVRWLFGFVKARAGALGRVLALSVAASLFALAQPYFTKLLIDDGLIGRDIEVVWWVCGALVGAGLLSAVLGGLNRVLYTALSGRILFAMREAVYGHLQRLSPLFFAERGSGDILTRMDGDIAEIQRFSTDSLIAVVNGVLTLAGSLAMMVWLSPGLTAIAFALLPLQVLILRLMRGRIETLTRIVRERAARITGFFVDTLGAMKFIQSVAGERREADRLRALNAAYLGDQIRLQTTNYLAGAAPNLVMSLGTAMVFVAGGYRVIAGTTSLGALIAFTVYLGRAAGPLRSFLGLYVASRRARVSLARVMELTRARPAVTAPARPRALPANAGGAIHFDNVAFGYPDRGGAILDGASLDIAPGARVAIIGASGVGKSTFSDLVHRHYDPDTGHIRLDGIDLRDLDPVELRRAVALVGQETTLFAGTLSDNIRYARPDATPDEVRAAAAAAQMDDFIQGLPGGYGSRIGQHGAKLSGGQRQRLAIARALLVDPRVLIFDEATTGIDAATEGRLIAAVDRLFPDRTRIFIGHRDSVRAGAGRLFELVDGKFIARPAPVTGRQRGAG